MYKALFFDIDGTLVPFGHKGPTPATFAALQRAKAAGLHVFIATGRPKITCTAVQGLEEAGLVDGYVTMNGSYCLVGDTIVRAEPIAREEIRRALDFCERHAKPIVVVGPDFNAVCGENEVFRHVWYEVIHVEPSPVPISFAEARERDIYQLSVFIRPEEEAAFLAAVGEQTALKLGRWHPTFTDISVAEKSEGIDAMCQHFGFSLSQTVAFGDGGNDVSMLRHAALGVAMGQAAPDVKAAARLIAPACDEEGVSWAIEKILAAQPHSSRLNISCNL